MSNYEASHSNIEPTVERSFSQEDLMSLQYPKFYELADQVPDTALASDLRVAATIAETIRDSGGLALVVGGFARDLAIARIAGRQLASKDIDIEVYGLAFDDLEQRLAAAGRVDLVGASFGIAKFTNPETGNVLDFSIPRRDSKVDKGHRGFKVTGDPTMSVREAARRRDLTINTLALNPLSGVLIVEFGGLEDLKRGILRATDPELFADDPLRVLRVMQFAGRFNFVIDPTTLEICQSIDLTEVAGERIGEEWIKLMTKSYWPSIGLEAARQLGVLDQLHPELAILEQIEQEPDWHPEGNVWNHTKLAVDAAAEITRREEMTEDDRLVVLFGALCHDLGKATTNEVRKKKGVFRITSYGHEAAGIEPTRQFLSGLKLKTAVISKIVPIVRDHLYHVHNPNPTDKQLQRFAQRLQPANIRLWNLVCWCDANGRGDAYVDSIPSRALYEQSLQLHVGENPALPIVQGRDLITQLHLEPGPVFKPILELLYDAQLDGNIRTVEEGISYYHTHEAMIQRIIAQNSKSHQKVK